VTGRADWAIPYWDWSSPDGLKVLNEFFGGNGTTEFNEMGGVTTGWHGTWPVAGDHGLPMSDARLRRCMGCEYPASKLPSADAVAFALNASVYDAWPYNTKTDCGFDATPDCVYPEAYSFRSLLEGYTISPNHHTHPLDRRSPVDMHNRVHMFVGGYMSETPFASNDPVFYPHHSFVDLLLEKWIRAHPDAVAAGFVPSTGGPNGHNRYDCLFPFIPHITHDEMYKTSDKLGYTYDVFL